MDNFVSATQAALNLSGNKGQNRRHSPLTSPAGHYRPKWAKIETLQLHKKPEAAVLSALAINDSLRWRAK